MRRPSFEHPVLVQLVKVFALGAGLMWPAAWKLEMTRLAPNLPGLPHLPTLPKIDYASVYDSISKLESHPAFRALASSVQQNPALREISAQVQRLEINQAWILGAFLAVVVAWYGKQRRARERQLLAQSHLEPRESLFSLRLTSLAIDLRLVAVKEHTLEWLRPANPALARQRSCVLWSRFLS